MYININISPINKHVLLLLKYHKLHALCKGLITLIKWQHRDYNTNIHVIYRSFHWQGSSTSLWRRREVHAAETPPDVGGHCSHFHVYHEVFAACPAGSHLVFELCTPHTGSLCFESVATEILKQAKLPFQNILKCQVVHFHFIYLVLVITGNVSTLAFNI